MTNKFSFLFLVLGLFIFPLAKAQQTFDLVPLGIYGGGDESNLSAYLLSEKDQNRFISLDAGTLRAGINRAVLNGVFDKSSIFVLHHYIKAYFISHGHLDHLSGMVINAPDDNQKPIYGTPFTLNILKNRYFTNDAWSNFANEGDQPLYKYTYRRIKNGETFNIEGTGLTGQLFELSHGNPYKSSALLITNSRGNSVLYFGDTGADRIENTNHLDAVWTAVAPLVDNHSLKAVLIENSFDSSRPDSLLFGHLTPRLLNEELQNLADKTQSKDLSQLKIIITHLKPGGSQVQLIKEEWGSYNPLHVQVLFPEQGQLIGL